MATDIRITTDGATVKTKGQDLIVSPRRIAMFGATILIGLFGIICVLGGIASLIGAFADGDLEDILEIIALIVIGVGLLSVAYFAFKRGKNQQAVHFDATQQQVMVGNEHVPFDSVTGVYLQHAGNTTLGDISGMVLQTGIVVNQKIIPIVSVSKAQRDENMSDAVTLVRLYAEHLGHDPKILGRYEDLLKLDLPKATPLVLSFEPDS